MKKEKGLLNDVEVKCPFYICHGADFIRCEGTIPDTRARIDFHMQGTRRGVLVPDEAGKKLHYKVFCCGKWRNCEQAEAVRRAKYEDE